jgi:ubiquinone/menaquinone biosynthesis C-methylase UbiE
MPDYQEIYQHHADQYELFVSREDYQQQIYRSLNEIVPFSGRDVVEFGAGTGRLTCMLAPVVGSIHAFDVSQTMLDVAIAKLEASGLHNWRIAAADHRDVPVADHSADIAISGWSICYMAVWYEQSWQSELRRAVAEMKRVLRPGGTIILLETLGTGHETPMPPDELVAYFAFLEAEGFTATWIRTDYRFDSPTEAEALARFFFGDALADRIREEQLVIVPECTGIWWLRV